MLTRSTPEGARDFLVPSRLQPGSFYALPQSPQLFKQLLMIAGFERYYQIARCFRDEDLRADRQLDFTQLDLEMSFVERRRRDRPERAPARRRARARWASRWRCRCARIPYDEAIARYGSDRPDLRFGLELVDLTDHLRETDFNAFRGTIDAGGAVKGMNVGERELPRAELDGLVERGKGARRQGAGVGLPRGRRLALARGEVPLRRGAGRDQRRRSAPRRATCCCWSPTSRSWPRRCWAASRVRLAERFGLVPEDANELAWIVDWPLFEWNEDEERWDPAAPPVHLAGRRARSGEPG